MNKAGKILVLIFAALLAVGAVLYFVKTMLDPPARVPADSGYVELIDEAVAEYADSRQGAYETSYRPVLDRIERFHNEGKITGTEYDRARTDAAAIYAPRLAQDCYRRLMMDWNDDDMNEMENRIYRLLNQRLYSSGAPVIDNDAESARSINEIADVLKLSREARNMCSSPTFISLTSSRSKMIKVRSYLTNQYLKHNSSLIRTINDYGGMLGQQHYSELSNQVDALAAYTTMSYDEFNSQYNEALAAISEYDNNAAPVYGNTIDTAPLRSRLERYRTWFN